VAHAHIGIAGAGLLGRLLAWQLLRAGHRVSVFDPAPGGHAPASGQISSGQITSAQIGSGLPDLARRPTPHAAAFTAAGMLSPLAELEHAGPQIAALGWRSLLRWREITDALAAAGPAAATAPLLRQHGSLLLAHASDLGAARRCLDKLQQPPAHAGAADWPQPQPLDAAALQALEPALAPGLHGWLLPQEGQLLPRELMVALWADAGQAQWHWGSSVTEVAPRRLQLADGRQLGFDLAIDARGTGAGAALGPTRQVRGVRGELLWLHAPGLRLQRPLRLLHPRHRVYLVPRPGDLVVVGASELESDDRSAVSLRSAVELMAAAHSVLPELAEARIVHLESNLRPALPDNQPHRQAEPGLLRINGLFRHGWLLAPALVDDALAALALSHQPSTALPASATAPSVNQTHQANHV